MTAYHPQSNGEWRGGTECSYQCCERLSKSWEDYVRPIRMAYNTSRVYSPLPNAWKTSETSDGADVWNACYSQVQNMPPNIKSSLTEPYEKVTVTAARQLDHETELHNKGSHMKWTVIYGFHCHK